MRAHSIRKSGYTLLSVLQWAMGLASAAIATFAQVHTSDFGPLAPALDPLVNWSSAHKWIPPVLTFCLGLLQIAKRNIGEPWVWDAIKHTLDHMQEHAFANQNADGKHRNRVTLFKRIYWKFCLDRESRSWWRVRKPWGGWLVPVRRSGHTTQNVSVVFYAPDDPEKAEGVAGQTWARDSILPVDGLPDVSGACTDANLRDYAARTWVSVDWLRREKSSARSLLGIPVRVKGEVWGVIVVDSQSTNIENREEIIKSYQLIAKVLGKLLERA
jgi:hypothetical protein